MNVPLFGLMLNQVLIHCFYALDLGGKIKMQFGLLPSNWL
jgi:hypothetical protein